MNFARLAVKTRLDTSGRQGSNWKQLRAVDWIDPNGSLKGHVAVAMRQQIDRWQEGARRVAAMDWRRRRAKAHAGESRTPGACT